MKHQTTLASALAAVIGLGALASAAPAAAEGTERCFGIAKKAQNDCGNAAHSCAGQAKTDKDPGEWKRVAKGTCQSLGGSPTPPAKGDHK
ncbi:MAG: DUF2282 domain-containing protein [Pseudomonadota bacterium]|nr:DUF2282 domain-containing protein [Pseudomonadota bacterium]